jgi:hypothetical protein
MPSGHSREKIEARAYQLWVEEGRPHGKHDEHWAKAAAEFESEAKSGTKSAAMNGQDTAGEAKPARKTAARKPAAPKAATKAAVPGKAAKSPTSDAAPSTVAATPAKAAAQKPAEADPAAMKALATKAKRTTAKSKA